MRLHGMTPDAWRRYLPGGSWRYDVEEAGLKANMTDLQAAIGRAQLQAFPDWQQRRHELAARYDAGLAGIDGLACRTGRRRPARVAPLPGAADAGVGGLREQAIETARPARARPPCISSRSISCPASARSWHPGCRAVPVAEQLVEQLLSLPMYPGLPIDIDARCRCPR